MELYKVGERIKLCRKSRKLTQEKLAELIDVSPHYIYEIERGTKCMSIHILEKVSYALNISSDYILFGEDNEISLCRDRLSLIVEQLSPRERERIADILTALLPHLK